MKGVKCRKGSAQQEKQVCPVQHNMLPIFDKWARSCSVLMPLHFYNCKSTLNTVLCRRNWLWQIQNYFNTNIVYYPLLCWLIHKPNSSCKQSAVSLKNSGVMPEVHGLFICCMIFTEKITSELSRLEYIYACGKSGIPPLFLDKSRK